MSSAGQQTIFVTSLVREISFQVAGPILLCNDNQSCVKTIDTPSNHSRIKHVNIKWHWIWEKVFAGIFAVVWVKGEVMIADILTKTLGVR